MKKIVISLAALLLGTAAWAQSIGNPAQNASLDKGFVRIGEIQQTSRNNVGAAAFLFPTGDKLVTGLHSSISAQDFLGGLKAQNSLYSQIQYNLVSYGWKGASGAFHTVEVGARAQYGLTVPKEIFQLLKSGTAQSPYDLSALRAFGQLYSELAYSYSRPLTDQLAVGARAKLLVGLNSVDVSSRMLSLTTTEEQYTLGLDADIDLTNRNKKIGADEDGYLDYTSFSGKGKLGAPTGAGLAVDLGLVWKPFRGFTLMASALDLGGMVWYYGNAGRSEGSYTFEGLKILSTDEMSSDKILSQVSDMGEEALKVLRPKAVERRFKTQALPFSAQLGASYALPFWERLAVDASALYTGYRFCVPYWEARGGLSLDFPGCAHLALSAGSGACGFVYSVAGSVDFLNFRLNAAFENGIGGTIPYSSTPLQANNKMLVLGLVYLIQ